MPTLVSLLFALAMPFSVRSLMEAGGGVGASGFAFFVPLALVCLWYACLSRAYDRLATLCATDGCRPEADKEAHVLATGLHPVLSFVPQAGRLLTFIIFATSSLGLCGYAFNEVFLYWVPNLLFSCGLLGALFVLTLAPVRIFRLAIATCCALALVGILSITLTGLFSLGAASGTGASPETVPFLPPPTALAAAFIVLAGIDLARFGNDAPHGPPVSMRMALVLAFTMLVNWLVVSGFFSGFERLSTTTLPHMSTARAVLGWDGRSLMGAVVILGSFAATGALLAGARGVVRAALPTLPRWTSTAIPCVAVLVLFLGGYAGKSVIEDWLLAGYGLWFVGMGLVCIAALRRPDPDERARGRLVLLVVGAVGGLLGLQYAMVPVDNRFAFGGAFALFGVLALLLGMWRGTKA